MNDFWDDLGKTLDKAQRKLDAARKDAERLAQEVATQAEQGFNEVFEQVQQAVGDVLPSEVVQIAALPEQQRVAYAGVLYALANSDGSLDREELQLIIDLVDFEGLSTNGRALLYSYIITPPAFSATLAAFRAAPEEVRYALMLNLVEIAWANDMLDPRQDTMLEAARQALMVSDAQYRAIWRFMRELRAIRLRGQNDRAAAQATKLAAAGLAAVGVPIAAVYVSGSVLGLSAAGITSGLAALGLGLGMVPGIGVAVLLGTGVFLGVQTLLAGASTQQQDKLRNQINKRTKMVIGHLEAMIALLNQQIPAVATAADTRANGMQLATLYARRRALQQIIARRRALAESLGGEEGA
ncbi:MAG: TerB family tellurite resistance protein [Candidatus Viridilinea halotolerans]|uniref:TerB family tellurite resistance protein n=1 Tax=Candidatus Viridilinea halotolerans TaxID=2491704 RepID=A0A426TQP1_9CHLR|nr:MAG: TerB family tellurite resistance protein [Candidatus Viridilinea halotolerans]